MVVDHVKLTDAIHKTLREVSTVPLPDSPNTQVKNQTAFDEKLGRWREVNFDSTLADDEVWQRICIIPFFAGVKPMPDARQDRTRAFLAKYREIGIPGWLETERGQEYILESSQHGEDDCVAAAYWNSLESKGPAIISAAANLLKRQQQRNISLLDIIVPKHLRAFRDRDLRSIFTNFESELGFGFITTFHAMMDLGLPVVKPDRMLVRTIVRLGLVTAYGDPASKSGRVSVSLKIDTDEALDLGGNPAFAWEVQSVMNTIAVSTGKTMREIDWLFAKMGMTETLEEGREIVICGDKPKCGQCFAHPMCAYATAYHKPAVFKKSKKAGRRIKARGVAEPVAVPAGCG